MMSRTQGAKRLYELLKRLGGRKKNSDRIQSILISVPPKLAPMTDKQIHLELKICAPSLQAQTHAQRRNHLDRILCYRSLNIFAILTSLPVPLRARNHS